MSRRFGNYYSISYLERKIRKDNSLIYKALLKYGYSNFRLDILEYCDPSMLIKREQYYIDCLKPEYNILLIAGNSNGFRHSLVARRQMSMNNTGVNHPLYGKEPSLETRIKIGESHRYNLKIKLIPNLAKSKLRLKSSSEISTRRGIKVKVFDIENNLINEFLTIRSAALHFCISTRTMRRILNNDILHEGFIYKFETVDNRVWIYDYNNKLIKILDNLKKASI